MVPLQQLAGLLGLAVVSGVNLYLSVLVVGLAERFRWVAGLPPELHILGHPAVLATAGVLFLLEFFADKIPFVTIVWDGVHTFIRPAGGALLALGAVGQLPPLVQVLAALAGGTIALGSHGTKMGVRILAHATPDPGTHSLLSTVEDLGVIGLLVLAYTHPYIALPVLGAILLVIALLLPLVGRVLRFLLAGLGGWLMSWVGGAGLRGRPGWLARALPALGVEGGTQQTVLAFARRVKGVPRLKEGFLARSGDQWLFLYRRFLRTRVARLDEGPGESLGWGRGFFWDTARLLREGEVQEFLLPRGLRGPTRKPGRRIG